MDRVRFTELAKLIGMKQKQAQKSVLIAMMKASVNKREATPCDKMRAITYDGDAIELNTMD